MTSVDAWLGAALPLAAGVLLLLAAVRRPVRYARVQREGGTAFLGERVMHWGYAWVDGVARLAGRLGLTPDQVSWLSLALGAAAGTLIGCGWLGAGAWLLAVSGLGDGVDGALARHRGVSSPAGAVLDSVLDRYVEFFVFAGLVVWFRGLWPQQLVTVAALFGGMMVTYSTAKAEAVRVAPPRGWMKRPERIVWLIGGTAFAAAAPLVNVPALPILTGVVALIAVFANLSAALRFRALQAAARG